MTALILAVDSDSILVCKVESAVARVLASLFRFVCKVLLAAVALTL